MNLHEYQAKRLFADYGIPVPQGVVAASVAEAAEAAGGFCARGCVVKAQVHAGGRGKAGGVKRVEGLDALREAAGSLLGTRLVTAQSGPEGQPVERVLVEPLVHVHKEFYLGALVDRAAQKIAFVASAAGGMEIEEIARAHPEAIHRVHVDPATGLMPFQARRLAFALGLGAQLKPFAAIVGALARMMADKDLGLVEINPLVLTRDGDLLALDAKVAVDDSALYRQPELAAWRDPGQEDPQEHAAAEHGLNYVRLDGDIGCMVNGAGLAMATMDLIQLAGGRPANFLDVGGGTTAEKVAEAFKLINAEPRVRAILVNIFGGIVRCDLIAEGIVRALHEVEVRVPVVVRLEGTRRDEGRALLERSGLDVIAVADLAEAARRAVAAAQEWR